jgi:3-hydroxymyristoyl/3-hydroxydecanoyl-(acyl carrier protein) dehydratase
MPENDAPVLLPEILARQRGADAVDLELRIPANLAYFVGHFTGTPILPGVVQIHWAVHYARECFEIRHGFQRMEAIKFRELILPGQSLGLSLRWFPQADKLSFKFHSSSQDHSSGRIYFKDPDV